MRPLMTVFWLAAATLLSPAGPALAQAEMPRTTSLTVAGEGHVDVAPDMAVISLGVTTEAKTAGAALAENNAAQAEILKALAAAGVMPRDIQTTGLNLNPVWGGQPDRDGRQRITGYSASNIVTVRVRKLDDLGPLLDKVVTTGANQLNSLTFGLADPKPAMDEARKRAVADALHRAQLYADAAGVTLGSLVSLSEGGSYQQPQPMFSRDAAMEAAVPVAGGEVGIVASVSVTYEIAD